MATDPNHKIALLEQIDLTAVSANIDQLPINKVESPGRPQKPALVPPAQVPRRSNLRAVENRAALLHAFAHIEFNAINLALDAIYRFREMPAQYYADWLRVAVEEAYHFNLLRAHLNSLGFDYGDFDAHNSLWEMAVRTDADVMVRMALVPRILEARGLDAVPPIREKLATVKDLRACEILDIILRDEIGHVRIGNHWYHWCCEQRGLEPIATFVALLREYDAPVFRGTFNHLARLEAGFSEDEMALIESLKT
ncbi:ferritin-like domain-containing protein [Chitinibacter fontanus]|uniref:Ferritin-like domain-containing protein n=1 Tax=Chitinibacter fontanus TaxID=1737446 RepID=A0A7D5VCQ2_9NEIS|nr:ferritin-like domain-containing protein [Chitinibacter fontanus]QLI83278.1 ferritin-like domain-containing protein [Chitinibacter fontanus]